MSRIKITILLLALALGPRSAGAGIADSPLPVLDPGQTTLHLYSVPGVMAANDFQALPGFVWVVSPARLGCG